MRKRIEIETAADGRFEMDYFRFGREDGRPVVMIPGLSLISVMKSAELVARQYELWAEDYQVFVMDRSRMLPEDCDVSKMAEDTARAMDLIGIRDAALFGVSQGGMIAQAMAARRPDLAGCLVLGSTASFISPDLEDVIDRWLNLAKAGDLKELIMTFAESVYTKEFVEKNRKAFQVMDRMVTEEDLARFQIMGRALAGFDMTDSLEDIRCPSLVISAEGDQVIGSEYSRQLAEALGGELYIYEGYSHAVFDEAPDYPERIYRFLKERL